MSEGFKDANIQEISNLLGDYFDGFKLKANPLLSQLAVWANEMLRQYQAIENDKKREEERKALANKPLSPKALKNKRIKELNEIY